MGFFIKKRSFTINTPLKNTKYYQIYTELQREAKKMTSINYDTLSLDDRYLVKEDIEIFASQFDIP